MGHEKVMGRCNLEVVRGKLSIPQSPNSEKFVCVAMYMERSESFFSSMLSVCKALQRTAKKRRQINLFLLRLYMDSAGMLPEKQLVSY